jgi:hypothetical protein
MKDVLLFHDNARPHTNLRTREAIAKNWDGLFFPSPADRPDLSPSDYHPFGPVKDALSGRHFADDNELKRSLSDVPRKEGMEFYNAGIQRLTQCWQTCVENDGDFVEK